jgi:hypothetical protein
MDRLIVENALDNTLLRMTILPTVTDSVPAWFGYVHAFIPMGCTHTLLVKLRI